ncbi:metallophosphoesterase [archaeon]|nr:metallophosphoesterase [archaeon]
MKILAIGDPHGNVGKIKKIPIKNIDLILLTGDLGKADLARKLYFENIKRKKKGLPEIERTLVQIKKIHLEVHKSTIKLLKYLSGFAPVYTIQGNVGIPSIKDVKEKKRKYNLNLISTKEEISSMKKIKLVKNQLRILNGVRIGFLEFFVDTCWVKEFKPKDYKESMQCAKRETNKARKVLKRFKDIDILVCHQPPYGILDKVNFPGVPTNWRGKHAGSKTVLNYIKKSKPPYVFCGHIHEGEGMTRVGKTEVYNLGVVGHKIIDV